MHSTSVSDFYVYGLECPCNTHLWAIIECSQKDSLAGVLRTQNIRLYSTKQISRITNDSYETYSTQAALPAIPINRISRCTEQGLTGVDCTSLQGLIRFVAASVGFLIFQDWGTRKSQAGTQHPCHQNSPSSSKGGYTLRKGPNSPKGTATDILLATNPNSWEFVSIFSLSTGDQCSKGRILYSSDQLSETDRLYSLCFLEFSFLLWVFIFCRISIFLRTEYGDT